MNVAIEELSPCQKKLKIQLSAEEVNKEYQTVVHDFRKNVAIPGFRKGKASISTIKRRFPKEIKNEVREKLLERSLKDALVEQKIAPVGTPALDVKNITVTENQPVEYDVEVEFIPPFELTDYKGVQIKKPTVEDASESSINHALESLQRQNAVNEPVADDYLISDQTSVTINYQRSLDGNPLGEPVKNYTIWLGVDQIIPELYNNLLGKKKGETFTFSVQYAADYWDKNLSGKAVTFTVEIINVEKVILPAIDDEFAKDLEQESLDALKAKLAEDIKHHQEQDAIAATKNQILLKLADTHVFDVPPSLIKDQQKKYPDKPEEEIKKMLRAGIILNKVQEQEHLSATDEEVDAAIERLATQNHMPVAAMKGYLTEHGGLERIRTDLVESKTLDFLYEHAQFVEEA
jgi:trigger factor